jgi:hypothetical protein
MSAPDAKKRAVLSGSGIKRIPVPWKKTSERRTRASRHQTAAKDRSDRCCQLRGASRRIGHTANRDGRKKDKTSVRFTPRFIAPSLR